jgi:hypothetical protein
MQHVTSVTLKNDNSLNYQVTMNIQFDHDTLTAVIDHDTYRRLTQSTEFQQSISLLAMLNQLLEEAHNAEVASMNLPPQTASTSVKETGNFPTTLFETKSTARYRP